MLLSMGFSVAAQSHSNTPPKQGEKGGDSASKPMEIAEQFISKIEKQLLTADWRKTIIDRRYVAVVEGEMEQEEGHIKSWLKDTESMKIISSRTNNGGKWSWTDWRLLQKKDGLSLIELHLHTGRKNQIRVHMSVIHHPIVGDFKYGAQMNGAIRMCLHAFRLAFYHPRTHEEMRFETPFPSYFLGFFK